MVCLYVLIYKFKYKIKKYLFFTVAGLYNVYLVYIYIML